MAESDIYNRQFKQIVNYRVDGDSKTDILRKFAKRWGLRTDSVQRYTSSPDSTRYRRIRDKKRQQSVRRIFNRMKREEEGFYYDLIIGQGEKLNVTDFAIDGIPDPLDEYPEVLGDYAYFLNELDGNIWKESVEIPRILFRTPGRGRRRMGLIKCAFLATVDSGDNILGSETILMKTSSKASQSGSTFGDFGNSRLGVRKPTRDLFNTMNLLIKNRYQLAEGRGYQIIRMVFNPKAAKRIFPNNEEADQCSIIIQNALYQTKLVRNVEGEVQYRQNRQPKTTIVPLKDVAKRLKNKG
tara:strand:- start:5032 stop:5922 length:891 start_codon:yes stop_codon:yes gene_type:complete